MYAISPSPVYHYIQDGQIGHYDSSPRNGRWGVTAEIASNEIHSWWLTLQLHDLIVDINVMSLVSIYV